MSALPRIDVVVPAFDEERHIDRCLDRILAQDYPPDRMRVIVVDAGSRDRTAALVAARGAADGRVALTGGDRRLLHSEALNAGIAAGEAELVARVDARTFIPPDYLRAAVDAFADAGPRAALVGGHSLHEGETRFGTALALARASRVGVGASVFADRAERRVVDSVLCGVYRRAVLEELGGFDPAMLYSEDEELNWRIRRAGHDIVLDGRLHMIYLARDSWRAAFRQYRNYGTGRVRVVRRHPGFLRAHHLVPAVAVAGGAALGAAAPFSGRARRALGLGAGAYALVTGGAAVAAARPVDLALTPLVAGAITALHAGYGVGMLRALPLLAGREA